MTSDEPTRPRRLQPRLPRDLEAITLHCLEKEPGRRYPSALALAEDLRRFREGKQVMARPVGTVARLARACRRRPLVAALLALLVISLFGGLGGVTWQSLEANQQRDLANARGRRTTEKQAACTRLTGRPWPPPVRRSTTARDRRRPPQSPEEPAGLGMAALTAGSTKVPACAAARQGKLLILPDQLRVGVLTRLASGHHRPG